LIDVTKQNRNNMKTLVVDLYKLFPRGIIPNNFMYNYSNVNSIIYINGDHIKKARNDWMRNCRSLKHIDLNCLTKLTSVGDCWLYNCTV
jgi:hypothetical protein